MNNDKYFVPDSDDIRPNYECEVKSIVVEDKWIYHKVPYQYYTSEYYLMTLENTIRTSYLTKEQIENEGWIISEVQEDLYYFQNKETGIIYGLIFNLYGKCIIFNTNDLLKSSLYRGKLKSINEFRYICKLLKI
jgi:hypothetical protein